MNIEKWIKKRQCSLIALWFAIIGMSIVWTLVNQEPIYKRFEAVNDKLIELEEDMLTHEHRYSDGAAIWWHEEEECKKKIRKAREDD